MIKKIWFITIILIFICHKTYSKSDIFIMANVNGEILTNFDIQQEAAYLKILNPQLNELEEQKIFKIAKNSLINETVKRIELKNSFNLDEDIALIDDLFRDFFIRLGFSNEEEFAQKLSNQNTYSILQIKKKMKMELFWNRTILEKYEKQIKINKDKLIEKIEKINEFKSEYLLSEIFFYREKNVKLDEQIKKIKLSIINVGFNNTASIYSKSESSNLGGNIGWINEENLSKKIIDELKKIKVGQYTNVIQFGNNFLILKIEDKKQKKIKTDKNLILEKMIDFEKNKQLNQFSNIYFNKIKVNYIIDEK